MVNCYTPGIKCSEVLLLHTHFTFCSSSSIQISLVPTKFSMAPELLLLCRCHMAKINCSSTFHQVYSILQNPSSRTQFTRLSSLQSDNIVVDFITILFYLKLLKCAVVRWPIMNKRPQSSSSGLACDAKDKSWKIVLSKRIIGNVPSCEGVLHQVLEITQK